MTARNERFIELYIQYVVLGQAPPGKRNSAAQAYIDSGYKVKDYRNAEVNASKLLSNPIIKAEVEKRKTEIMEKQRITTEKILKELGQVGFAVITDYFTWDEDGKVKLKPSKELSRDKAAAIASIEKTKDGFKIRLHDKNGALELLGRNKGAFPNKVAIGGDPENPNPISQEIVFKGIPRPNKEDLPRPDAKR
jgi:phage terminase small subunit